MKQNDLTWFRGKKTKERSGYLNSFSNSVSRKSADLTITVQAVHYIQIENLVLNGYRLVLHRIQSRLHQIFLNKKMFL